MLPEIFQYDFMLRAFAAGTIIAVVAPLIGNFLIIRRYSLFADALSHVSFLSIAVAVALGISPIITSIIGAIMAASLLEHLRASRRVQSESSLILFLSGSLALGTIILSVAGSDGVSIGSILFGSITTVVLSDIAAIAIVAIVALVCIIRYYREFFVLSFDEEYARVKGIPVARLNYLLMILASLIIAISITSIGILLISSLIIIPVLIAYQFKRGFHVSVLLSILISIISVWIGLLLAYYMNIPAGSSIVLVLITLFLFATIARRLFQSRK